MDLQVLKLFGDILCQNCVSFGRRTNCVNKYNVEAVKKGAWIFRSLCETVFVVTALEIIIDNLQSEDFIRLLLVCNFGSRTRGNIMDNLERSLTKMLEKRPRLQYQGISKALHRCSCFKPLTNVSLKHPERGLYPELFFDLLNRNKISELYRLRLRASSSSFKRIISEASFFVESPKMATFNPQKNLLAVVSDSKALIFDYSKSEADLVKTIHLRSCEKETHTFCERLIQSVQWSKNGDYLLVNEAFAPTAFLYTGETHCKRVCYLSLYEALEVKESKYTSVKIERIWLTKEDPYLQTPLFLVNKHLWLDENKFLFPSQEKLEIYTVSSGYSSDKVSCIVKEVTNISVYKPTRGVYNEILAKTIRVPNKSKSKVFTCGAYTAFLDGTYRVACVLNCPDCTGRDCHDVVAVFQLRRSGSDHEQQTPVSYLHIPGLVRDLSVSSRDGIFISHSSNYQAPTKRFFEWCVPTSSTFGIRATKSPECPFPSREDYPIDPMPSSGVCGTLYVDWFSSEEERIKSLYSKR